MRWLVNHSAAAPDPVTGDRAGLLREAMHRLNDKRWRDTSEVAPGRVLIRFIDIPGTLGRRSATICGGDRNPIAVAGGRSCEET